MPVLYTAVATARANESAEVRSQGEGLNFPLHWPIRPPNTPQANLPEQLFAAGFAASFGASVAVAAAQRGIDTGPVSIRAHVALRAVPQGGQSLCVRLEGDLPQLTLHEALALMQLAEGLCPYAKALRGNIPVLLTVAHRPHGCQAHP